ncbi:MAG: preprotein translocase subunit SecA [Deltaproteobacteria bacterium]|nr:preprotein translocase subunit SecA [Deltaproteobacteria bacterium]
MLGQVLKKIVGSKNERDIRRLTPLVEQVGALEPEMKRLSDDQLRAKTGYFKEQIERGATLDDIMTEAFAVVREASVRTLGQRHFDVQVMGGIVLHEGKIAEMKTGEGKTLAATMPVYLNALLEKGVHVVTVNDYLARRDAEWMGAIYKFLGLSVGVIVHDMDDAERRASYGADITYGTNNEFGFDYLRDNMKFSLKDYVQRDFYFCIVDEVDSILIDEARTPLIISGPANESTELYYRINRVIPKLKPAEDYVIDEKARSATLTEEGIAHAERILKIDNLYDPKYLEVLHHLNQALKAHALFKRDVDYIVKSGDVIIVDEFTGRLMPGRRYSDGLHQALEAKENVKIERENQTLASITFQNYFRMYEKLSGMTGTADTEAAEFRKIYDLDVVVIPTNEKMIRIDNPDVIYRTEKDKFNSVVKEIEELHNIGRPVLVGTISIEKSELLSKMLKRKGIPHNVLNAKHHEKEAEIVAQAGQKGAVTISTNMAGRGTDIVLGEGVAELGGLHILGTERHESRRIDNQLRGRAGRQGDKGSSRFYLSLEDDLLRIFGSEHIQGIMGRLGMDNGEPIENKLVTRAIENAQRKVEGHHFEIRKHLLEYDDVMNQQRDVIYRQRRNILAGENLKDNIYEMIEDLVDGLIENFTDEKSYAEEWDLKALKESLFELFGLRFDPGPVEDLTPDGLREMILDQVREAYERKEAEFGAPIMRELEQFILLQSVDNQWKDHLLSMDHLKEGIGLRGYGQRDPLREYQKEGYEMFMEMIDRIKVESISLLFHIRPNREESLALMTPREQEMQLSYGEAEKPATVKREGRKIGRNEPCPCGSGKKYKKCCGRNV